MLDPSLLRGQLAETAARLQGYPRISTSTSGAMETLEAERKQLQARTQELQNLRNTRSQGDRPGEGARARMPPR